MPPRPMSACVESRAGVDDVVVLDEADAQAAAPTSRTHKKGRMCKILLRGGIAGGNKLAHLPVECGELGDAIRANAVDADALQDSPVIRIVCGPRDALGVGRVRPSDQLLVDERDLLPEILRSGSDEGCHRIDVTAADQHARSQSREDVPHGLDDTMVEGVYGAVGSGFSDAPDNQGLDILRLDLHVYHCSIANRVENRVQSRDLDSLGQWKASEIGHRELGDSRGARAGRVYYRVVVDDDRTVFCAVDVQLDRVGAQVDRPKEGRNRVLGKRLVCTPVRDPLRHTVLASRRQAFLGVVTLGTMSAKLRMRPGGVN